MISAKNEPLWHGNGLKVEKPTLVPGPVHSLSTGSPTCGYCSIEEKKAVLVVL